MNYLRLRGFLESLDHIRLPVQLVIKVDSKVLSLLFENELLTKKVRVPLFVAV